MDFISHRIERRWSSFFWLTGQNNFEKVTQKGFSCKVGVHMIYFWNGMSTAHGGLSHSIYLYWYFYHLSLYLSFHPSIHPSVHPSIHCSHVSSRFLISLSPFPSLSLCFDTQWWLVWPAIRFSLQICVISSTIFFVVSSLFQMPHYDLHDAIIFCCCSRLLAHCSDD